MLGWYTRVMVVSMLYCWLVRGTGFPLTLAVPLVYIHGTADDFKTSFTAARNICLSVAKDTLVCYNNIMRTARHARALV